MHFKFSECQGQEEGQNGGDGGDSQKFGATEFGTSQEKRNLRSRKQSFGKNLFKLLKAEKTYPGLVGNLFCLFLPSLPVSLFYGKNSDGHYFLLIVTF